VPSAAIVPTTAFPPRTPFTLHDTKVSVAFFTVAVNSVVLPSRMDPACELTATVMTGGGGGGGAEESAPPAQPASSTPMNATAVAQRSAASQGDGQGGGEGRMPFAKAGEWPAKIEKFSVPSLAGISVLAAWLSAFFTVIYRPSRPIACIS
jgi:hypothetical protein